MKLRRKRSAGFLCFGATAVYDDDDMKTESSTGSSVQTSEEEAGSSSSSRRRTLTKVFRSGAFVSALKRNKGSSPALERKESDASDERSVAGSSSRLTEDDERRTDSSDQVFTPKSPSSTSSASSASSLSSSATSHSPPETKPRRRRQPKRSESEKAPPGRKNYHPATGLFLLLISLCVMVIFGRLCAILWTATWLYLAPRRISVVSAAPVAKPGHRSRVSEEDEKRRVVLEGLLERNHRL
ncbi:hypothetical protein J5N97_027175 [Dioscorea zingiberensis]|uniref:Uncharacterized protein n=1 Tax=Dioscorea zingiberensis TaxID=325984 RepID=A0A9D5C3L6_9LILI|nr:hypothetical protein J5N97_027175 [Dioscorea zingiberensis]